MTIVTKIGALQGPAGNCTAGLAGRLAPAYPGPVMCALRHAGIWVVLMGGCDGSVYTTAAQEAGDGERGSGTQDVGHGGGVGPGAPATGPGSWVASRCDQDADCAPGLSCVTADDDDMGQTGAANGYCTASCQSEADCPNSADAVVCAPIFPGSGRWCLLGCRPHGAYAWKTDHCRGRIDLACFPADSAHSQGACVPMCTTDADCGRRYCDLETGTCVDRLPAGLPMGAPCAAHEQCVGWCDSGYCTGYCTYGTAGIKGACGAVVKEGAADAACLWPAVVVEGATSGWGDTALCGQLCDCTEQCRHPDDRCWAPVLPSEQGALQKLGRRGYCAPAPGGAEWATCP